jgi:hypothetical protein
VHSETVEIDTILETNFFSFERKFDWEESFKYIKDDIKKEMNEGGIRD